MLRTVTSTFIAWNREKKSDTGLGIDMRKLEKPNI